MFNIAKVMKDLSDLTDVVLMQELRDTATAIGQLQQKNQLLQNEANRRIDANKEAMAKAADQAAKLARSTVPQTSDVQGAVMPAARNAIERAAEQAAKEGEPIPKMPIPPEMPM